MPNAKITKTLVDKSAPAERDQHFWDTEAKGFGLKITPTGSKVYVYQYRYPPRRGGKTMRVTIGKHGSPWTPDGARVRARELASLVANGQNPRALELAGDAAMTVAQLCDDYLLKGTGTKKASTLATDKGRIEAHIKPLLGTMRINEVTRADISAFQSDVAAGKTKKDTKTKARGRAIVTGGKGTAARTLGLLGGIFSYAVDAGLLETNPARGVKRYPDKRNERYLNAHELKTLGEMLDAPENKAVYPTAITIIRLLALTGARRGEIQNLKWSEVDLERSALRLDDSKTGQKIVRLNAPALDVLKNLIGGDAKPQGYVFPNSEGTGPYEGTSKVWSRLRKDTALGDVRLHDLRHTFASLAIAQGMPLAVIGKLLGHANASTTQRYAHLADDPVTAASDQLGATLAGIFSVARDPDDGT
ncbi:tyrosine-type recombinase/integrase [Pelagibacterium montanilacus]|uniref:tyrosine-type recombinase/integrase n=1 Tax=Pelagibacterium montanilacus TaxID=2185280 RepID=UPI000F8DFE70|nr:site-specific integrase [Pelagibacterium montanilacus]